MQADSAYGREFRSARTDVRQSAQVPRITRFGNDSAVVGPLNDSVDRARIGQLTFDTIVPRRRRIATVLAARAKRNPQSLRNCR
jgi:hypothetical protein